MIKFRVFSLIIILLIAVNGANRLSMGAYLPADKLLPVGIVGTIVLFNNSAIAFI